MFAGLEVTTGIKVSNRQNSDERIGRSRAQDTQKVLRTKAEIKDSPRFAKSEITRGVYIFLKCNIENVVLCGLKDQVLNM